jgi:lysophospholipase-3
VLPNLAVGRVVTPKTVLLAKDGDVNQEDITDTAIRAWKAMRCYRFSLVDNRGVNHFSLPSDRTVLHRLIAELARPRSRCA